MKRDTFLPSITTLLIFGMTVFLSCAHQNRVRDGIDEQAANEEQGFVSEEGSATPAEGEQPQGELADLGEQPKQEGEAVPTDATTQAAPAQDQAAAAPNEDAELKALGIETTSPTESANLEATTQNPGTVAMGEDTAGAVTTEPGAAHADGAAPVDSSLDPLAGLEGAAAGATTAEAATTNEASQPKDITPTTNTEITRMEPIIDHASTAHVGSAAAATGWSGSSTVPKIPAKPVHRKGADLNRFYMVRGGDTPKSVSHLIYGSEDHASDLIAWNGKSWNAGKVIYYKSSIEANDPNMRSFYQERGIQPEEYTVRKGDWLSKVAKRQLGDSGSWKEIAVVNGMSSPDNIDVGQKLALYPKDLAGVAQRPVVQEPKEEPKPVAQEPEPAPQQVVQQQQPQQQTQQPQNQPADPSAELQKPVEPPPQQAPAQEPVAKKDHPSNSVDTGKLVEQNLPAVFILGGVLVLSALYLVVRRKKGKKNTEDFGDESFAPPTKLKRK